MQISFHLRRVRGKKIDVQMRIRAMGPEGLIFWTGEEKMTSSSDFLALGVKDGHVQFSYNLGSGEVIITYNETRIDDGKWHKIRAQRWGLIYELLSLPSIYSEQVESKWKAWRCWCKSDVQLLLFYESIKFYLAYKINSYKFDCWNGMRQNNLNAEMEFGWFFLWHRRLVYSNKICNRL